MSNDHDGPRCYLDPVPVPCPCGGTAHVEVQVGSTPADDEDGGEPYATWLHFCDRCKHRPTPAEQADAVRRAVADRNAELRAAGDWLPEWGEES